MSCSCMFSHGSIIPRIRSEAWDEAGEQRPAGLGLLLGLLNSLSQRLCFSNPHVPFQQGSL